MNRNDRKEGNQRTAAAIRGFHSPIFVVFFIISVEFPVPVVHLEIVIFTESAAFARKVFEILSEDDLIALEDLLMDSPDAGAVVPGSRGLRKIRVASGGKGKRGGSRVIYYWYVEPEKIQFCRIYEKSSQGNLSRAEIEQILTELDP